MFRQNLIDVDGHVDKLKKVTFREDTNCMKTASDVIYLLSGESAFFSKKPISYTPINSFLKKDPSVHHPIIKDLLSPTPTPEHSLFLLEMDGNAHALVIEKKSNQEGSQYRVYQSWVGEFSLIDWLEGEGKNPYTSPELLRIMRNIVKRIEREHGQSGSYNFFCCCRKKPKRELITEMIKFDFNSQALEKNYNRIINKAQGTTCSL